MADVERTPLASPALGTDLRLLIAPCGDKLRPADPGRAPDGRPTFALTFSGGGFRATLAALGVLRFLADCGRLGDVRFLSSVSGGSIANAMVACRWGNLRAGNFTPEVLDREVIHPIIDSIAGSSLKSELLRNAWRTIGPPTRTDLLADALDRRFFQGRTLDSLDAGCRFVINAANLITGTRFAFERDVLGDYVLGLAATATRDVRVATGVAASAAVPGAFAPVPLRGVEFPCGERGGAVLVDGGAYDNTGLEAFDSQRYRDLFSMTLNAGGVFVTGPAGRTRFVRDLARANSLLYRQSTTLRTRWMVERFRAFEQARDAGRDTPEWGRQGVLVSLATDITGVDTWRERHPEHRSWKGKDLAFVPTVFDRLDRALCRLLVYRGWWLIGAAMARYHPGVVDLPMASPPLD